jgi:hypothetical protein
MPGKILSTSVAIFVYAIGRRIPAFAILFRPYPVIGNRNIQILKTLKVHYTSSVMLSWYRISILLPISVNLILEICILALG